MPPAKTKCVQATADGTQVTATVTISATAHPDARVLRVSTPNGVSVVNTVGIFVVTQ